MLHKLINKQVKIDVSEPLINASLPISDSEYYHFLKRCNGGFFFEQALHLYSVNGIFKYCDIEEINRIFQEAYGDLAKGAYAFGQDVFGNQFIFISSQISLFNIETAEIEPIANSFIEWIEHIFADTDYLTGVSILQEWKAGEEKLEFGQRLCPKKPFVVGGEYSVENLYNIDIEKNLLYNSHIAKQIHDLPDGTPIKFGFIE
jgi:SMI1 / KNR4 family (SUKH-1)